MTLCHAVRTLFLLPPSPRFPAFYISLDMTVGGLECCQSFKEKFSARPRIKVCKINDPKCHLKVETLDIIFNSFMRCQCVVIPKPSTPSSAPQLPPIGFLVAMLFLCNSLSGDGPNNHRKNGKNMELINFSVPASPDPWP